MNRIDKDKCIALSNYTNWVIQDDAIILCGDHHEMSDEDAAALVYKAQRTQEYTCNHRYLKDEHAKLYAVVDEVIKENVKAVIQYTNGDGKVLNYLIGMVHKKTGNTWGHNDIIEALIPKLDEAA
jgi:Asp-tRNA(Asn)/Glu-tRNA(Gln) amidotransferase B subunit